MISLVLGGGGCDREGVLGIYISYGWMNGLDRINLPFFKLSQTSSVLCFFYL